MVVQHAVAAGQEQQAVGLGHVASPARLLDGMGVTEHQRDARRSDDARGDEREPDPQRVSDLERGENLAGRKGWYEAKHPESASVTKRSGPGRGHKTTAENATVSYVADTAAKTGASQRTIRQAVQKIAESIPEDVRDAVLETPLPFARRRACSPPGGRLGANRPGLLLRP